MDESGDVLTVACPYCDASIGERCMQGKRKVSDLRRSHRVRFDVINVDVKMCKNKCGKECPKSKLRGKHLFCSDKCRIEYWSTPLYDRPK